MEILQPLTDQMSPEQLGLFYAVLNEIERYRSLTQDEKLRLIRDVMDRPYVDLLCDWAFKHVFGNNLDLLELLLRDIMQMDLRIERSLPNEIDLFRPDDKNVIMDVICQLGDGRRVIVEMQQEKKVAFKDRIAYYGAANFVKQLRRGENYNEVRAVYVICFANFKMRHTDCPPGKIIYTYEFREQDTGELFGEYISLNFCELPRLLKDSFEDMDPKEEWFHLLKNMRTFALNPKGVPQRLRKVLEASRTNALPDDERIKYFRAMISEEEKEDIATANYQDGLEDGREQQALEVARRMLEDNLPIEAVAKYSGLSEEQVRSIR